MGRSRATRTATPQALGADLPYVPDADDDARAAAFDAALRYLALARRPLPGREFAEPSPTEQATETQAEAIAGVIMTVLRSLALPEPTERRALATAATELRRLEARGRR